MTEAEKAYQAAESVIEETLRSGSTALDFSGEIFGALNALPPSIAALSNLRSLSLSGTEIVDIQPIANLSSLEWLELEGSPADLFALVAPGAAWERNDGMLRALRCHNTPLAKVGGPLADIARNARFDNRERARAILRALRENYPSDRAPPPPAPPPNRPFVFLSYSRENAAKAAALRTALEADGVTIWQDVEMRAGARFREEIAKRIDASAAVLVLWSEASVGSDYVISEAERARAAGKIVPAMVETCAVPAPFDVFNTVELRDQLNQRLLVTQDNEFVGTEDGRRLHVGIFVDREAPEYQSLVASLREYLTPGAEVGATLDSDRRIAPAQKPVGAPPPNDDALALARALRAQVALINALLAALETANTDNRIAERLPGYRTALQEDDPLWEIIDDAFDGFQPLLAKAEAEGGVDEGIVAQARRLKARHLALEDMLRPEQPAEKPAPIDRETPEEAADPAMALIGDAADAMEGAEEIAAASPAFLRHEYDQVKQARDDARADFGEASGRARRKRLTGAIVTTAGFIASVLAIGQAVLPAAVKARLAEIWVQLMRLVFG